MTERRAVYFDPAVAAALGDWNRQEQPREERHISGAELRRGARKLTVTFEDARLPAELRALAEEMGLVAHTGQPNVSRLIEAMVRYCLGDLGKFRREAGL